MTDFDSSEQPTINALINISNKIKDYLIRVIRFNQNLTILVNIIIIMNNGSRNITN